MSNDDIFRVLLIVFTICGLTTFYVHFVKKIAFHIGAIDVPNARKVHIKPMPRLGGLGIFLGFLTGYILFCEPSTLMNSILIGSFIIVLTGMIDDIKPLSPKYKLIGQIIAASIVIFYGNVLLVNIDAFGFYIKFSWLSYPLTLMFILGCINCINLIDGLDGLAGGISAIYFLTIGIIATFMGSRGLDFVLCYVMFAACLGFLFHNFYPAKIFMGDSGSMFLGFIIAVIALLGFKNVTLSSLIIPLLVLAIPILDTLFAIIRRKLKGEKISTPDRFHIHHQLLNRNFSQRTAVIIIYLIDLLFASASIIYVLKDNVLGYFIYGILLVIVIVFVAKTNIVFEHNDTHNVKKRKTKK